MAGAALYASIDGYGRLERNDMTVVGRLEATFRGSLDVALDRARAAFWRIRGAAVASKVRVGAGSRVLRPWCLSIGHRGQLEHNVFIKITDDTAQLAMGESVFIGCGSEFDVAFRVSIGSNVLIAPGCFITDHSHRHLAGHSIASQGCESSPVRIGDDVWLGAHSIVLPGVSIGSGAIVGANSVVTCNVESMTIVAGSPARVVGARS